MRRSLLLAQPHALRSRGVSDRARSSCRLAAAAFPPNRHRAVAAAAIRIVGLGQWTLGLQRDVDLDARRVGRWLRRLVVDAARDRDRERVLRFASWVLSATRVSGAAGLLASAPDPHQRGRSRRCRPEPTGANTCTRRCCSRRTTTIGSAWCARANSARRDDTNAGSRRADHTRDTGPTGGASCAGCPGRYRQRSTATRTESTVHWGSTLGASATCDPGTDSCLEQRATGCGASRAAATQDTATRCRSDARADHSRAHGGSTYGSTGQNPWRPNRCAPRAGSTGWSCVDPIATRSTSDTSTAPGLPNCHCSATR